MAENSLILGTAGHIDHGKTSLVKALTGVDTDRLAEEKKRGITIELGFARFAPAGDRTFGVVDVPGHEGFIRTMVAGATGVDVVLLVVAADEGVMPQTREHLSIVRLLGVETLVVALTKVDLVEEEWLELVVDEVRELLAPTLYADAPIVPTSVADGTGIEELARTLAATGAPGGRRLVDDVTRLPVDRVFTVEGAGTVVTGTLWSGSLAVGENVTVLPIGEEARVRRLQVHGRDVENAQAGQRTAAALTGAAVRRGLIERGHLLVTHGAWRTTMMLTVHLSPLPDSGWSIEHGQRVRIHLATTEVMARVVLLGGGEGDAPLTAQLRLEAPLVARAGDRFVVRSYSPMTTIAGGVVLEPSPPKRKRLARDVRDALAEVARGGADAIRGAASLAGWEGLPEAEVVIRGGRADAGAAGAVKIGDAWFSEARIEEGQALVLEAVAGHHRERPLDPGMPLEALRKALPRRAREVLAEGLIRRLADAGLLLVDGRHARLPGFTRELTRDQEELRGRLRGLFADAGLQPPGPEDLPDGVAGHRDLEAVLGLMVEEGELAPLGESYLVWRPTVEDAARDVVRELGGRTGLGPADFKDVLPVTRKHLIPLLTYLDTAGITLRQDGARSVVASWEEAQIGGAGV